MHRFDAAALAEPPWPNGGGAQLTPATFAEAGPAERPVVLYVEDHPVNVLLMEALFERRPGLHLVVAVDGQSALQAVARLSPALLMLDLGLPDCHGTELLAALRRVPQTALVPAVAVTADDEFRIDDSGFLEVWLKPLRLAAMLCRVDELCTPRMGIAGMPLPAFRTGRGEQIPALADVHWSVGSSNDH